MIRHGWREGPLLSRRDPGATREKPRTSQSTISGETAGGEAAEAGHFGGNRAKRKEKKYGVYERKRGLGDKKPSLLHVGARGRVCGVDGVVAERWSNGWRPQGGA